MSGGRIVVVVIGSLLILFGLAVAAGGGLLLWADQTQRDADGWFTSDGRLVAPGRALVSDDIDLGEEWDDTSWATDLGDLVRTRVTVAPVGDARATFVGIGPRADVQEYLRGVAHSRVVDVEFDPFRADYVVVTGARVPGPPAGEPFWSAQVQGAGPQTLEWEPLPGEWTVVAMNADASRGVAVEAEVGVRIGLLGRIATGLLVGGLVILALGVLLMVLGFRGRRSPGDEPPAGALDDATAEAAPPR